MISRYSTLIPASEGATAQIFKAEDLELGRPVALKYLRRGLPSASVERLFREARALASLRHPGICQIFDLGQEDEQPFIAMEWIDGVPLSDLSEDLTLEEKLEVGAKIADVLAVVHHAGIVHRDLKPDNILVRRDVAGEYRPVVVDFGLAFLTSDESPRLTTEGMPLGTPSFMAPEQATGSLQEIGPAADIFSLGACLYQLLTGHDPYAAGSKVGVLYQVVHAEAPCARTVAPTLSPPIEGIIRRCMEKEQGQRYARAEHVARDLRKIIRREPVSFRMGLRIRWAFRRLRAHWRPIMLAMIIATSLGGWGWLGRSDRIAAEEQALLDQGKDLLWSLREIWSQPRHDIRAESEDVHRNLEHLEGMLPSFSTRNRAAAQILVGQIYLALGESGKALDHFQQAWEGGLQTPELALGLGKAHVSLHEDALFEADRLEALQLRDELTAKAEKMHSGPARAFLELAKKNEKVSEAYLTGLLQFYEGELEEALRIVRRQPHSQRFFEVANLEGRILTRMAAEVLAEGDASAVRAFVAQGSEAYRTTIERLPSHPSGYLGLCRLLSVPLGVAPFAQDGSYLDTAEQACRQGLEVDPEHVRLRAALSRVLVGKSIYLAVSQRGAKWYELGSSIDLALAEAQKALRSNPESPDAILSLARTVVLFVNRESHTPELWELFDTSIDLLEEAVRAAPERLDLTLALISTEMHRSFFETRILRSAQVPIWRALQRIEDALVTHPDNLELHHLRMGATTVSTRASEFLGLDFSSHLAKGLESFATLEASSNHQDLFDFLGPQLLLFEIMSNCVERRPSSEPFRRLEQLGQDYLKRGGLELQVREFGVRAQGAKIACFLRWELNVEQEFRDLAAAGEMFAAQIPKESWPPRLLSWMNMLTIQAALGGHFPLERMDLAEPSIPAESWAERSLLWHETPILFRDDLALLAELLWRIEWRFENQQPVRKELVEARELFDTVDRERTFELARNQIAGLSIALRYLEWRAGSLEGPVDAAAREVIEKELRPHSELSPALYFQSAPWLIRVRRFAPPAQPPTDSAVYSSEVAAMPNTSSRR